MVPESKPRLILIGKERTLPILDLLQTLLSDLFFVEVNVFRDVIPKCYTKTRTPTLKAIAIADYVTSSLEIPEDVFAFGIGFTAEKLHWNDDRTGEELLNPDSRKHLDELLSKLCGRDYCLNVGCSLLSADMSVSKTFVIPEYLCVKALTDEEKRAFVAGMQKQRFGKVGPTFPFRETDEWRQVLDMPEADIEIIAKRILHRLSKQDCPLNAEMRGRFETAANLQAQ
ncbi:MAG TPA: hypothetical protein VN420_01825 [Candidatus Fimivivens sp.]|nr:hypothetical protein [Candidatus Fimivivens sp.]